MEMFVPVLTSNVHFVVGDRRTLKKDFHFPLWFCLNMAEESDDDKLLLFFIVVAVSWSVCILQAVGIHQFSRLRGLMIIQKRYPRFVMVEAIVSCVVLFVVYPAVLTIWYETPEISISKWPYFVTAINTYTIQIPVVIEASRIWLISYDLQYLHSSKNQKWKTQIDVSYAEKDWYLQNRAKWGNKKYVARVAFAYYIITSTAAFTTILLTLLLDLPTTINIALGFSSLIMCFVLPIFILSYLFIKTPRKLQDEFLFQYG